MRIRGNVDGIHGTAILGWAQDADAPHDTLEVEVTEGNRLVSRGLADRMRPDLHEAGIGNGNHGFEIALPAELFDGKDHALALITRGGRRLGAEPLRFRSEPPIAAGPIELVGGQLVFQLAAPIAEGLVASFEIWDGCERITTIAVGGPVDASLGLSLPADCFDGRPHHFSVRLTQPASLIGECVVATPAVRPPASATARHDWPGQAQTLTYGASQRYQALHAQLEQWWQRHMGSTGLGPPETGALGQLLAVHDAIVAGPDSDQRNPHPLHFPEVAEPVVSIVIPCHNQFRFTYHCLASLLLAQTDVAFEVVIVDDGSTDSTRSLESLVTGIRIVRHEEARGFVHAVNAGAAVAIGKYVLALNNDVEVCSRWLDELLWPFGTMQNVGMTGAMLLYPDGRLQEAGGVIWGDGEAWNYGRNGNADDPRYTYTRPADYLSGACILVPKPLWDELGGFDAAFAPAYYEDTDLAFRIRERGLKTIYAPLGRVIHFEGKSNGTFTDSGIKRHQALHEPLFRRKWFERYRQHSKDRQRVDLEKDRGTFLRALLIDAQTPTPNHDAGSYAAVQEMRLLQSLGFQITFAPQSLTHAGTHTRDLQRMGIECLYAPFYTSMAQLLQRRGAEFDLVYVTRYNVAEQVVDLVRHHAPRAKLILNNADLHFLRELRAAIAAGDAKLKERALTTRTAELAVMRKVDLVLSYSTVEHAVIQSHNADSTRVMTCPWVVEVPEHVAPFESRSGIAFLGSFRHPPNLEAMRRFTTEVMPGLRKRIPGITLKIYGSHMTDEVHALAAPDIHICGRVETVADVYDSARVFVAPLISGAGIKGKVISALAHGIPCVLSPIAAEGIGLRHGEEALIADPPKAWLDAIASLYQDRVRWENVSVAALNFALHHYSFERGREQMQTAIESTGLVCRSAKAEEPAWSGSLRPAQ